MQLKSWVKEIESAVKTAPEKTTDMYVDALVVHVSVLPPQVTSAGNSV